MHKVNIIWRANLLVILIASHGFNIRIIDIFLKIIVETNYWLKTLIKLKACLHIKLSILHPISVKYQNIHGHIFSVSRNLVRKGAIEITLSNLFVMFISQLSATEFPKSYDGFMNETTGPIFFSFLFHYLFFFLHTNPLCYYLQSPGAETGAGTRRHAADSIYTLPHDFIWVQNNLILHLKKVISNAIIHYLSKPSNIYFSSAETISVKKFAVESGVYFR